MEWCAILFQGLGKTSKSGDRSGRAVCQFCWDAQMLLGRALMQEQEPRIRGPGHLIGADYIINNWPSAMRQVNFWIVPANIHTDRHDADRSVQQAETCVYNMSTNHVCSFRSKIFRKTFSLSREPLDPPERPADAELGNRIPHKRQPARARHRRRPRDRR